MSKDTEQYAAKIYIPRELWDWLRKHAIDERTSASRILARLAEEYRTRVQGE